MLSINYPISRRYEPPHRFYTRSFPRQCPVIDTILDHLAHNRGVKLEGFREPDIIEALSSEYMATHWNVQPARLVEVHVGVRVYIKPYGGIPEWVADYVQKNGDTWNAI